MTLITGFCYIFYGTKMDRINEYRARALKEHARGDKPLMIWLPEKLHRAFREEVFKNRTTMRAVTIRFIEYYTGVKVEEKRTGNGGTTGTDKA